MQRFSKYEKLELDSEFHPSDFILERGPISRPGSN